MTNETTETLDKVSRITRGLWILGIIALLYCAIAVSVASAIGVWNSFKAAEHAEAALAQARLNGDLQAFLVGCLTPGPKPPNVDRTGTGNPCYDALEGNRAAAVKRIIDADGNGVVDATEVRAMLTRIERALRN